MNKKNIIYFILLITTISSLLLFFILFNKKEKIIIEAPKKYFKIIIPEPEIKIVKKNELSFNDNQHNLSEYFEEPKKINFIKTTDNNKEELQFKKINIKYSNHEYLFKKKQPIKEKNYIINLGIFSNYEQAKQHWETIVKTNFHKLNNLEIIYKPIINNDKKYFKLIINNINNFNQAEKICSIIKENKTHCIINSQY